MTGYRPKRIGALVPAALLLSACATSPAPTSATPGVAYGGTWVVTDSFPAGTVTDPASAPRGQRVRMDAGMAGDAAGRSCPWPDYRESKANLAAVIGGDGATAALAAPVGMLEVDCAGTRFASYAIMADGSLLTRYGAWLLRLEHGERLAANPAPMTPPEPAAALPPPQEPPPPVAQAAPPPAVPAAPPHLVYLASYKTEAWARKGWGILAGHSASLKPLAPVLRPVDLKDKGKFVRLFAPAASAAEGRRICAELGKAIGECGAPGRDK